RRVRRQGLEVFFVNRLRELVSETFAETAERADLRLRRKGAEGLAPDLRREVAADLRLRVVRADEDVVQRLSPLLQKHVGDREIARRLAEAEDRDADAAVRRLRLEELARCQQRAVHRQLVEADLGKADRLLEAAEARDVARLVERSLDVEDRVAEPPGAPAFRVLREDRDR